MSELDNQDKNKDKDIGVKKDEEFLGDFRSRMEEASSSENPFQEDKGKKKAKNKGRIIGSLVGVIIATVLVLEFAMPHLGEPMNTKVPTIRRSTAPVKVRPSDPGGMDVPNRDKQVYSRIGEIEDEPVVEHLLPIPEKPIEPTKVQEEEQTAPMPTPRPIDDKGKPVKVEKAEEILGVKEKAQTKQESQKELEVVKQKAKKEEIKPKNEEQQVKIPLTIKVEEVKTTKEEPEKVQEEPTKEQVKKTAEKPATKKEIKQGSWQVQIVSVKSKDQAQKAYDNIISKHKSLLENIPYEVVKADLGAKGIYYRLKVGAYNSRDNANNLCNKLKAKKQGCFVTKKN